MVAVAQMIQDDQERGPGEGSPGHPGHQAPQAYGTQELQLNREDLLYLRNPLSHGDLTRYGHQGGANLVENFEHAAVLSDEVAESDLQKFCQNTLDKAGLAQFGIRS